MTDEPTGLSPEARALIAQARGGDDPSDADRARVRRALLATVAGGAGLAATSAASSAAASTVGTGLAATVAKVAAVILVVGGVGAGTVMVAPWEDPPAVEAPAPRARASRPTVERAAAPAPQPPPVAPAVEAALPVPVDEPSPPVVAPEPPAAPRAETVRPRPSRPAPVEPPPPAQPASLPASTLAAEVALLRSAQAALNGGDPETALARLGDHARRFPDGAMAEEREAARVLALCRAGRDDEARGAADRFLRERPQSPLVPRVRRGCER